MYTTHSSSTTAITQRLIGKMNVLLCKIACVQEDLFRTGATRLTGRGEDRVSLAQDLERQQVVVEVARAQLRRIAL